MATQTTVKTGVTVNTWTKAVSVTVNETMSLLSKYVTHRGFDVGYLKRLHDNIEEGLKLWLTSRNLAGLHLEVFDRDTGELIDKFELDYVHTPPKEADQEIVDQIKNDEFEILHKQILNQLQDVDAPPETAQYRLVAELEENEEGQAPPPVEGWQSTALKSTDHLNKKDLGTAIDAGSIQTSAAIWLSQDAPAPGVDEE